MKKLLITGVSGFLGWHIYRYTRSNWNSFGTYFSKNVNSEDPNLIKIDLTDSIALTELFATLKPDAVIHAAALSKPNLCQESPEISRAINVDASRQIAELCSRYGIPCVFTSTDLVFDGKKSPYKETDPVSPVSIYGEDKVKAEIAILEVYPNTAVCRLPLMFGSPSPTADSFIQPFIKTLQEGRELSLFTDEYRTPASARAITRGLLLALERVSGILHLGGKERVSRYEFGLVMARVLNLPTATLKACLQADVPMSAPRPKDVSLDISRAIGLGYDPSSIEMELEAIKHEIIGKN
ncbi:NAD(P)-dependent oxidoreductase [Pannus brasiliensis CCIBt3594]|uniref:dTDP-4-dehydrorhamnose reductase n=1 Tax=Pannus brasiliensis CCIBt3594 TaxID=1427578 RepID=A0AAW9R0D7_9CHRO